MQFSTNGKINILLVYILYIYPSIMLPIIIYYNKHLVLNHFTLYLFLHLLSLVSSYWDLYIYNKKYYDQIINPEITHPVPCDDCIEKQESATVSNNCYCNSGGNGGDDGCILVLLVLMLVWIPLIIFIKGKEILIKNILKIYKYNVISVIRLITLIHNIVVFVIIYYHISTLSKQKNS